MKIEAQHGSTLLFKAVVGSQSYGTNVPGSDIDHKAIHIAPLRDLLLSDVKPQIEYTKDYTSFEIHRFLELLKTGNPTVLELLYTPEDCIVEMHPLFKKHILPHRDAFLTKQLKNSFCGYAVQQIQKANGLDKKMNWESSKMVRKSPLDFCYIANANGTKPVTAFLEKIGIPQELCGLTKLDNFRDGYSLWADVKHWARPATNEPVGLKGIVLPNSNEVRVTELPENPHLVLDYLGVVTYNKDG